jgi:DNA repair protein RadC
MEDTAMQTDTITLRELTIRYSVKADVTGQPVVIGRTLSTPAASAAALSALLRDEPGEVFAILCLSTKHRVIAYHEVSRGTLDATLVHPRLCSAQHKRGYVAAVVMCGSRLKASGEPASRSTDAT